MKTSCLIVIALSFILMGCSKQSKIKRFLTKTWTFSETPRRNSDTYMGNVEDKTIFEGTESITFTEQGDFLVNNMKYGTWSCGEKSSGNTISITQVPYEEYSCCGSGQTYMEWEILELKKNKLVVKHGYYKYPDNQYDFK